MDGYVKSVLTVIAVCLVIQTSSHFVQPAHANTNEIARLLQVMMDRTQKIAICSKDGTECAGIVAGDGGFFKNVK